MFNNINSITLANKEIAKIEILQQNGTYKTWYEKDQTIKILNYTIQNSPYDFATPDVFPTITVVCNKPIGQAYTEPSGRPQILESFVSAINDKTCTIQFYRNEYAHYQSSQSLASLFICSEEYSNDFDDYTYMNFIVDAIPIGLRADTVSITVPYNGWIEDVYFDYQLYDFINERILLYGQACIPTRYDWETIYEEHGLVYETFFDLQHVEDNGKTYNLKVPVHVQLESLEPFTIDPISNIYLQDTSVPFSVSTYCNRNIGNSFYLELDYSSPDAGVFEYSFNIEGNYCEITFYFIGPSNSSGSSHYYLTVQDEFGNNATTDFNIIWESEFGDEPDFIKDHWYISDIAGSGIIYNDYATAEISYTIYGDYGYVDSGFVSDSYSGITSPGYYPVTINHSCGMYKDQEYIITGSSEIYFDW